MLNFGTCNHCDANEENHLGVSDEFRCEILFNLFCQLDKVFSQKERADDRNNSQGQGVSANNGSHAFRN